MEIKGASPGRVFTTVQILRPDGKLLELKVQALPLGYWAQLGKWIPAAVPPLKGHIRDKDGHYVKDGDGRPLPDYDWLDEQYLVDAATVTRLQDMLCLAEALSANPELRFNAKPNRNRMRQYAEALLEEMTEFGFSDGDFSRLTNAILTASQVTPDRIKKAREDFLAEKEAKKPPAIPK